MKKIFLVILILGLSLSASANSPESANKDLTETLNKLNQNLDKHLEDSSGFRFYKTYKEYEEHTKEYKKYEKIARKFYCFE